MSRLLRGAARHWQVGRLSCAPTKPLQRTWGLYLRTMSWFEKLFGEPEGSYQHVQQTLHYDAELKEILGPNGQRYGVGTFTTPSLRELREAGADGEEGPLTVQHITTLDALVEHAKPENRGALFQAASQFNCLEFPSPGTVPESGVSGYESDNTQGPACAMAAGAGTVFRNYFVQVDPDQPEKLGQRKDFQLNNLRDLEILLDNDSMEYWRVSNGYVFGTEEKLEKLASKLASCDLDELAEHIRIGFHRDVQVTFEKRFKKPRDLTPIYVSQAYCSAISCSYSGRPASVWEPLAKLVLDAAYEATLWAGVINNSKTQNPRVLLTFLGGGVFGNKKPWIAAAICRAIQRLHMHGKKLEVVLVHFSHIDDYIVKYLEKHCVDENGQSIVNPPKRPASPPV
eukprot:m.60667 g.60667  ORF g.60667 m.60667 type:complete len:398 (+) comp7293_c0_seq3:109-1302(+)